VLGSKVLFAGADGGGHANLWITDGTSAGTSELTVARGYAGGLFGRNPGFDEPGFTVFGNRVLFVGDDVSGNPNLWVTDGTSTGTAELAPSGASATGLEPDDITVITAVHGDFNDDRSSDFLWQNSSGEVAIWELNGTSVIGSGSLGSPGPSWHTIGTGDFNADGFADILWENADGSVAIWEMNGASLVGSAIVANPGPSWHAVGSGDFNGDGFSDILWQNTDGSNAVWEMNGTSPIASAIIANPGPTWHA
jgi:ELWxxDGT repeat protein